jgi:hypothetical protein
VEQSKPLFLGHYGVAFAAKRAAPRTSLGTLLVGAQFLDLLWPVLLLAGVEHVRIAPGDTRVTPLNFYDYPISHSLLTTCGWAILLGGAYWILRRYWRGAWVLALAVTSHWVLDFISHRPDMPLTPGGNIYLGLGLWNSLLATILVEGGLFALGVTLYLRTTRSRNKTGSYALGALIGLLVAIYLGSLFGPPPPSMSTVAWLDIGQWLLVAWMYWVDANRTVKPEDLPGSSTPPMS